MNYFKYTSTNRKRTATADINGAVMIYLMEIQLS